MNIYLGLDIGGTNIRVASFGSDKLNLIKKVRFDVDKDFDKAIKKINSVIESVSKGKKIVGIGVAAPGIVDPQEGIILDSSNLPSWNKKPIKKLLGEKFNVEVRVNNDMLVSAIGEYLFGYGKNKDKFLFIIWGTGFGGAYVRKIGSKIDAHSLELGHQILIWNGDPCGCKQRGCAEVYVGGGYAARTWGNDFSDKTSGETWNKVSEKAGHALVNTLNHFPVDLVVFGGGVVSKQTHLIKRVKDVVTKYMTTYPAPEMKLSELGENAGIYGGLGLFHIDRV